MKEINYNSKIIRMAQIIPALIAVLCSVAFYGNWGEILVAWVLYYCGYSTVIIKSFIRDQTKRLELLREVTIRSIKHSTGQIERYNSIIEFINRGHITQTDADELWPDGEKLREEYVAQSEEWLKERLEIADELKQNQLIKQLAGI